MTTSWVPLPIEDGGTGGTTPFSARRALGLEIPTGGADNVTFLASGTGAVARSVQDKLRDIRGDRDFGAIVGTNTDQVFGTVSVHDIRTTIDRHAFEDYSLLNTTDTGFGYACYDAKATMTNSLAQDHIVGFQSRVIYNGSANLTNYFHSFDSAPVHTGAGTIVRAVGLNLADFGGTGPITNNIGIYLADFTRGAGNFGIYQEAQTNALNVIGAPICFITPSGALNYFNDAVGKSITYGFGSQGQTQFGVHNFYDGKAGLVVAITSAGIKPKASGYLSSDGTVGLTQASTTTVGKSITLKDGLVVAFA